MDARPFGGGEQFAQRHDAGQLALDVDGVDGVHCLAPLATGNGAHLGQRGLHGFRVEHRHHLGGHQAAGGVGLVLEQLFRLAAGRLGNGLEDVVGGFLVHFLEHVGALVGRHLRNEGRRLRGGHPLEQLGADFLVEVFENGAGPLGRQGVEERREALARQRLGDVGEVGGVQLFGFGGDRCRIGLEQVENVGREQRGETPALGLLVWRHGTRPGSRSRNVGRRGGKL